MTVTTLPTNASYGTVTGRFLTAVADTVDAGKDPDGEAVVGTVVFTPSVARVHNGGASPDPVTIFIRPITCNLDTSGYLLGPDGTRGVVLLATDDPDLRPVDANGRFVWEWYWTVEYRFPGLTTSLQTMHVPGGTTINVTVEALQDDDATEIDGGTAANAGVGVIDGGNAYSAGIA